jgi:hypothetical protein
LTAFVRDECVTSESGALEGLGQGSPDRTQMALDGNDRAPYFETLRHCEHAPHALSAQSVSEASRPRSHRYRGLGRNHQMLATQSAGLAKPLQYIDMGDANACDNAMADSK